MTQGRVLLNILKTMTQPIMPTLCIPVGSPVEGTLRPVATRKDGLNVNDVRVLTEWRNRFVRAFLHEFEATERRTERWLTDMVGPDDTRILFMLDDPHGQTVGYMGLAYIDWEKLYGEADAIVRGRDVAPGLMTKAMRTLMNWASGQLGLQLLGVRVRSDNTALDFYRKFGFKEHRRVPLRVKQEIDGLKWDEDLSLSAGEISLVHMLFPSSTTHG